MAGTAATVSSKTARDQELTQFFVANSKLVIGFLIAGCGCPEDEAEDIAQDAFLAVRGRWDHVRGLEEPKAYLFKVAKRRFWHLHKSPATQRGLDDPEVHLSAVPDPVDTFAEIDGLLDALALLRQLPPGQRQVVWLRHVADFSEAQAAEILSVSPGTVKSQLHVAKAKLEAFAREAGWLKAQEIE